jgi:hypothetical protein
VELAVGAVEPEGCAAIGFHRKLLLSLDDENSRRVRAVHDCVNRGGYGSNA